MEDRDYTVLTDRIRAGYARAGLDLVQPFNVAWYNALVTPPHQLPHFGNPDALGILVGNSRALWSPFVRWLRESPRPLPAHPIDDYVVATIERALEGLEQRWKVRYAHLPAPRHIGFQRLADVSGLAHLGPAFLSVHTTFGPWIALQIKK